MKEFEVDMTDVIKHCQLETTRKIKDKVRKDKRTVEIQTDDGAVSQFKYDALLEQLK